MNWPMTLIVVSGMAAFCAFHLGRWFELKTGDGLWQRYRDALEHIAEIDDRYDYQGWSQIAEAKSAATRTLAGLSHLINPVKR